MMSSDEVSRHSVHTLVFRSLKRTHDMFLSDCAALPSADAKADKLWRSAKARAIYGPVMAKVNDERSRGTFGQNTAMALTHEGGGDAKAPPGAMMAYQGPATPRGNSRSESCTWRAR